MQIVENKLNTHAQVTRACWCLDYPAKKEG